MTDPPDRRRNQLLLNEPKFVVITRTDNNNFDNVSPFLIKKTIDYAIGGELESCKKTRAGTLLCKTKNYTQAYRLLKLNSIGNFNVTATEHKTLNSSKGVIYSNELRNITEAEILSELKPQNVTEVRKIMKKSDQILIETGLITITFSTHKLPESLRIGYEYVPVRPYIPLPLKCKKCLRFGHPTPICKSKETCNNCSEEQHTKENEKCNNPKNCLNCKNNAEVDPNHSPLDRKCPTFLKQQELIAIKTTEKVDHKTALNIYHSRHSTQIKDTFAKIVSSPTYASDTSTKYTANNTSKITQHQHSHSESAYSGQTTTTTQKHPKASTSGSSPGPKKPTNNTTITSLQASESEDSEMDIDTQSSGTVEKNQLSSQLSKDLKLRIFTKEKTTLSTTLKPQKNKH